MSDEGRIPVTGGDVWYRVEGDGDGIPLLCLHGGPGSDSSAFFGGFEHLGDERPVVVYDQLGSLRSSKPGDAALWTVERFVEELGQVRAALGLDEVHLLGHSWGSMLAAAYLATRPAGVQSVVFSSPCISASDWRADQLRWAKALPEDVQQVIADAERDGTTDSPAYEEAMGVFYRRHVCRLDPWPREVEQMFADMNLDVYGHMWGPSEFTVTGTLQGFDATDVLRRLDLPSLFVCGEYDEAAPWTVQRHAGLVAGSSFSVISDASHMTMLEQPESYWSLIAGFTRGRVGSP